VNTPIIGISTYRETASWGIWSQTADVLHREYADAVAAAGGAPVLLPPAQADATTAEAVVSRLDGLIIAGGADVDPDLYGETAHPATAGWRPDRDAWELTLLTVAEARQLPVLGICRGMQLMAVAAGGALSQHTPDEVGHEQHSPGGAEFGPTTIRVDAGSRVAEFAGTQVVGACHHHQSVRDHPGFRASAWADDGTVEAMEVPGPRFCVAVQWHPEMHGHTSGATSSEPLFSALIAAARDYGSTAALQRG
jgi:putative glutamine amidotransferase